MFLTHLLNYDSLKIFNCFLGSYRSDEWQASSVAESKQNDQKLVTHGSNNLLNIESIKSSTRRK